MIIIIDYKAGNLASVKRALDHLGIENVISPDPGVVAKARRIIFPGVGNAASAMENMRSIGMDEALRQAFRKGVPILGICLGAQIILEKSEEGGTSCIGLLPGTARRFEPASPEFKIPHMGWNSVAISQPHKLLSHLKITDEMYFVHSYFPQPSSETDIFGRTDYDIVFPSAIGRSNLFATQFHPEKSGRPGLELLDKFSTWDGVPC